MLGKEAVEIDDLRSMFNALVKQRGLVANTDEV